MNSPSSCDTFVCLPNITKDNVVIFGKNSDRPSKEVQDIVYYPAATFAENTKLNCTYIEIDQVTETLPVILSQPNWMWGAEMGANSYGVCIGNEAVWARIEPEEDKKLLGMDLVRLGLERGKSAREALDVIVTILEQYGQGGPCSNTEDLTYHNSYLMADCKEAWVLETVGKYWAAEQVTEGYRNISNCLSIGTKVDLASAGLKDVAQKYFKWNSADSFEFASIFGYGVGSGCSRYRSGKVQLQKCSNDRKFDCKRMMSILRHPQINMGGYSGGFATTSSQVSLLRCSGDGIHWFTGSADSEHSIFKPFMFNPMNSLSETALTDSRSGTLTNNDNAEHELYKHHRKAYHRFARGNHIIRKMKELEDFLFEEVTDSKFTSKPTMFGEAVEKEIQLYVEP